MLLYPCHRYILQSKIFVVSILVHLLAVSDIECAYHMLITNSCNYVYPVTEYPHPIQRSFTRSESGSVSFLYPEHELTRTQDLEIYYHDTGMFYWGTYTAWASEFPMHTSGLTMTVPHWRVVDIDNEDDWKRAEVITRLLASSS